WASARRQRVPAASGPRSFFSANSAMSLIARSNRLLTSRVFFQPASSARVSIHFSTQSPMALESPDLQTLANAFASFLYRSRFGRGGRGRASCGLGVRISFHGMPGVRPIQAERRFVPSVYVEGGHRPFRELEAPRALADRVRLP